MKPTDEELEAMAAKYDHTADDPMLDGVSAIKRDLLIKRDLQNAALLRACKGLVRLNEATQARAEAAEAERDALKKQGEREGASAVDLMIRHMNRWKAAEAAIQAALERLDASLFTNAEHQQAKDILRAALTTIRKEGAQHE
jgi:hypothetical protein